MKEISGKLEARGLRFAILAARFNTFISERLIEGAVDCLVRHGCEPDAISVVRVPGSFEIPGVARRLADSGQYSAVIALGALIRGATPHFEYVARSLTAGLGSLAAEGKVPVSFGVLTTDTIEQAVERAGTKSGNKGFDAALAAIEMANLYAVLSGKA
jgi:6,7-dimethyl-8-ribityllumazine synthase